MTMRANLRRTRWRGLASARRRSDVDDAASTRPAPAVRSGWRFGRASSSSGRRLTSAAAARRAPRARGGRARRCTHQHADAPMQHQRRRRDPEDQRVRREHRLQQHELAVAIDEVLAHLLVGVAGRQPLAHQHAQIRGRGRRRCRRSIRSGRRGSAGPAEIVAGARLERRIGQHLVWVRPPAPAGASQQQHAAAAQRAASFGRLPARPCAARRGAPTRRRRSVSDRKPANAMSMRAEPDQRDVRLVPDAHDMALPSAAARPAADRAGRSRRSRSPPRWSAAAGGIDARSGVDAAACRRRRR